MLKVYSFELLQEKNQFDNDSISKPFDCFKSKDNPPKNKEGFDEIPGQYQFNRRKVKKKRRKLKTNFKSS
jgi:hypothetical protein